MMTNYQTIKGVDPAFQQAFLGGLLLGGGADRPASARAAVRWARDSSRSSYIDTWFLLIMTGAAARDFRIAEPGWLNSQTIQNLISRTRRSRSSRWR